MNQYTLEQFKKLQKYWQRMEKIREKFYEEVYNLEAEMVKEMGIPEIEFAHNYEGYMFGIGNKWAEEKDRYPAINEMCLTGEEEYGHNN